MSIARYEPPTAITRNDTWIEMVQPAADLAAMIADTDFVPTEMRKNPAAIAACVLYGAEIGLGPMVSLSKISIIKGKPAPSAELGRALALAAGHEVWVDEQTNTKCKVSGRRRGSAQLQSATWTLDDVKKAGIGSHMYAKYPRQMLLARASAELVRMMCPDALGGITRFAEEFDDTEPADTPITATTTEPVKATTTRRRTPPPPAALPTAPTNHTPAGPAPPPPLPGDEQTDSDSDGLTPAQLKKLHASFGDNNIDDRDDRLRFAIAVTGRPIESSKDLTKDEASRVIDALDELCDGRVGIVIEDDGSWTVTPDDEAVFDQRLPVSWPQEVTP